MKTKVVVVWAGRLCAVALGTVVSACSGVPKENESEVGATEAALQVVVDPPANLNCFNLTLRDSNDVETSYQAALAPTMRFRTVPVGAYEATASAYQAANCSVVPLNAPWSTSGPTDVIVKAGQGTAITLQLVKVGRIVVNAEFVDRAEVVAAEQGAVGSIAAIGNKVAWVVNATADALGSAVTFTDNGSAADSPSVIATDQSGPADINIESTTGDVYWTNRSSGATDGSGNPIPDGSVWRYQVATGTAAPVASAEGGPFEIAASAGAVYWNDFDTNEIRVFAPPSSTLSQFVGAQPGSNSIALVPPDAPTKLLWTNIGDGAVRFVNLPSTSPIDVFVPPAGDARVPISVAGDETHVYWTDLDQATQESRILRAPYAGGPVEVLYPHPGDAPLATSFNAEVSDSFVYVNSIDGVKRLPKDGSGPLEIIQGGQTGGLALTSFGGVPYIFWTDANFGGVVWRARLE